MFPITSVYNPDSPLQFIAWVKKNKKALGRNSRGRLTYGP